MASHDGADAMRLDILLWYLRLVRTRALAQAMVAGGHVRLDGRRVERSSVLVRPGSVLVVPAHPVSRVLRIMALPDRRGPPAEAALCYAEDSTGPG